MFLREIKAEVKSIRGVGPSLERTLANLGILAVPDLLQFYPRDWEDRSHKIPLANFASAPKVNTIVVVEAHEWFGYGRTKTLKVLVSDGTAEAYLVCFNRNFIQNQLTVGGQYFLYGAFQVRYGEIQSTSFEFEPYRADREGFDSILPVYPLTAGLNQGTMRKLQKNAVSEYGTHLENELPAAVMGKYGLITKAAALKNIHFPESMDALMQAQKTLIYEELFWLELLVGRRAFLRKEQTIERKSMQGLLGRRLVERLPFELTPDQKTALAEIVTDLGKNSPMARLLQGDVGSGKTLVAFLSSLASIEAGGQVAIMAPTELLARQHADTAGRLLEPIGVRLAFLTGNVRDANRKPLLEALGEGKIDLVIGTHALFSEEVKYANLRLVVIDEQHRFGVLQRLALSAKGKMPDLLMMTATPIPRTLALTEFGDLSISTIKTMPAGRKPIESHLARQGNEKKVYDFIAREISTGNQAYFVYPLIGQSEKLDLKDAESMFERLKTEIFPGVPMGLIHSKVPEDEKRATMRAFTEGGLKILVATSVVEVGVDVPNATCIVIEHAERFGLSALHQLRGRVGRGTAQSYAFFVYSNDLTEDGKKRLMVMKEHTDGFFIAEEDMKIRGPGEIVGTAQSGNLRLSIADPVRDLEILQYARTDAFAILEKDPGFINPDNLVIGRVLEKASPFSEGIAAKG